MLLTLYYMAATFFQSWRLNTVYGRLSAYVTKRTSIAYFVAPNEVNDSAAEVDSSRPAATSDLCTNASQARIADVIWNENDRQGIALTPKQHVMLDPWITFPEAPNLIPFEVQSNTGLRLNEEQVLYALVETQMVPVEPRHANVLMIEEFGVPIAWKVDSRIAILIRTDLRRFASLIQRSFMLQNLVINDNLPLDRIESVDVSGEPQPFDSIRQHSRAELVSRSIHQLSSDQWKSHVDGLRQLNILASQASEFKLKKNRTEGKTGLVKPDLIPVSGKTGSSPRRLPNERNDVSTGVLAIKKPTPRSSPLTSPLRHISEESPRHAATQNDKTDDKNPPTIEKSADENLPKGIEHQDKFETPNSDQIKKEVTNIKKNSENNHNKSAKQLKEVKKIDPLADEKPILKSTDTKHKVVEAKANEVVKINSIENKKIDLVNTNEVKDKSQKVDDNNTPIETKHIKEEYKPNQIKSIDAKANPSEIFDSAKLIAAEQIYEKKPTVSCRSDGAPRPTLIRSKGSLIASKPPNILVYSDSAATRDSVISTLSAILEENMYTIYPLSVQQVRTKVWIDNTTMLVVCGSVSADIGEILTEYFLSGGKMLSLCSDVLHIVLPMFRTHAEVREHELVQFSYGRWHKVRMMHHIFCYQPSPVRKHFSTDSDEAASSRSPSSLICPRSVEVDDMQQKTHNLQVQVLGTEETWNTPSLILATNASSGGKAVFSQVHLEADPNHYEHDEIKFSVLRQSNKVRIEIFSDLLSSHLGIVVRSLDAKIQPRKQFSSAYFLGDYKTKFELIERLRPNMSEANTLHTPQLALRFCDHREQPPAATESLMPILINSCPENFSTIDYFDNLKASTIGRIAIYSPIITSTNHVLSGVPLSHGLAVIGRQQTAGRGRGQNQWLSPDGCLMFSVQLHIELHSPLGQHLSLLQHLMAVAIVNAILSINGYEDLHIRLKWPNDIYANGSTKIGGLVATSTVEGNRAVCNLGCGVNLNNSSPTVCLNDLIHQHNLHSGQNLAPLGYEQLLALTFTELERLLETVQGGDLQYLYDIYDRLWLHSDAEVRIIDATGVKRTSKIIGIDEYGFLLVQRPGEPIETVHPDGNSFDMLRGLIVPKNS